MASSPSFASPAPPCDTTLEHEESHEESVFFGQATESWARAEQRLLDRAGNRRDTIVPLKLGGTGKEILLNQSRNSAGTALDSLLVEEGDTEEVEYNFNQPNPLQSPQDKENIATTPLRSTPRPSPFNSPDFLHSINKIPLLLSPLQSLANAPSPLRFYTQSSPAVLSSPRSISTRGDVEKDDGAEEEISIDGSSFDKDDDTVEEVIRSAGEDVAVETEPEVKSQEMDTLPLDDSQSSELFPDVPTYPIDSQVEAQSEQSLNDENNISTPELDSLETPAESLLVQVDSQKTAPDLSEDLEELVDDSEEAELSREIVLDAEVESQEEVEEAVSVGVEVEMVVELPEKGLSAVEDLQANKEESTPDENLPMTDVVEQLVDTASAMELSVDDAAPQESEASGTEEIGVAIVVEAKEAAAILNGEVDVAVAVIESEEDVSVAESMEEFTSAEVSETEIEEDDSASVVESADVSLVVSGEELEVEVEVVIESQVVIIEEEMEISTVEAENVSDGDDSGEEFDEEESELEADQSISVDNEVEVKVAETDVLESAVVGSTLVESGVVEESHNVLVELDVVVVAPVIEETETDTAFTQENRTIEALPAVPVETSTAQETSDDDLAPSQQSTSSVQSPSTPGPSHAPLVVISASSTATIVDKTPKASSSTPVATSLNRKKQQAPALAAPTARRQLSTLTSSRAPAVSTLKRGEKRRSGLVANLDTASSGRQLGAKLVPKNKPTTEELASAKNSPTVIRASIKSAPSSTVASTSSTTVDKPSAGFSSKLARPGLAKFASTSRLPSSTSFKRPTVPTTSNPPVSKSGLASSQNSSSAFGGSKPALSRSMSATISSTTSKPTTSTLPPPRSRPLLSTSLSSSSSTSSLGGKASRPNGLPAVRRFPAAGAPRQRVDSSSSNGSASSTAGSRTNGLSSSTSSLMRPPSAASSNAIAAPRIAPVAVNRPLLSSSLSSSLASTLSTIAPPTFPRARVLPPPLAHTFSAPALLMPVVVEAAPLPSPLPIPTLARPQSQTFPSSASSTSVIANVVPPVVPVLPSSYRPLSEIVNLARQNSDRSPEKRRALRTGQTPKDLEIAPLAIVQPKISENSAPSLIRPSISARSLSSQVPHSSIPPTLSRSASTPSFHSVFSHSTASAPSIPFPSSPQSSNTIVESQEEPEEKESILTADLLVDAEVAQEIFRSQSVDKEVEVPVKLTKTRRTRAKTPVMVVEEVEVEAVAIPVVSRPSRRTAATIAAASISNTVSRPRPSRKNVQAESSESAVEIEAPVASGSESRRPIFNPAPSLTQEELTHLTQRNTMKNKAHFNKLDVQTIHMDENRPPSPSTKVRKSLSNTPPTSSAGGKKGERGERANKRRSALRSSIDGSGSTLLDLELAEESQNGLKVELEHFRAPGDEEEFHSPVRPPTVLKSKGKKKSSSATKLKIGLEGVVAVERKRVKWDRALVYEGPFESDLVEGEEVIEVSILKQIPLDSFGNSTATSTGYAKPASVCIKRILYKDDE